MNKQTLKLIVKYVLAGSNFDKTLASAFVLKMNLRSNLSGNEISLCEILSHSPFVLVRSPSEFSAGQIHGIQMENGI